jgi:hypothetical protein
MEQRHFRCLLITLGLVVSSSWAAALMGPVMGSGSRDPNPAGHRTSGTAFISSEASVNGTTAYTGIRLTGTADLLVHHIHAFTIHVTALILVKGVLFARSSRLVIDKRLGVPLSMRWPWSRWELRALIPRGALRLGIQPHVPVLRERVLARAD